MQMLLSGTGNLYIIANSAGIYTCIIYYMYMNRGSVFNIPT